MLKSNLLTLLLLFCTTLTGHAQVKMIGSVESYVRDGNVFLFTGSEGGARLEFIAPSVVRIQASWSGRFADAESLIVARTEWPEVGLQINENEESVELSTSVLQMNIQKEPFAVDFLDASGRLLNSDRISQREQIGGLSKRGESVHVEKRLFQDEHFFGFGERMDFMDRRGKRLELNVGRGTEFPHIVGAYNILEANYSPIPFFMSTRGYGIFFNTPYATHWDMGESDPGSYSFEAENGQLDYYFMYGPDFSSILNFYTDITGKSPLLPEFVHGLNVGTYSGGTWGYEQLTSDAYVVNLGRRFRESGIPADVLHLDSTWRIFGDNGHGSTTFEWRKTFENPRAMFDSLYAMDFNMVGVHVRPRYDNGREFNLLDQAREAGMVYPEPGGTGEFVNFFDPEATAWWWENGAEKVISQGAMFFKTDEGSAFGRKANESAKTGPTGPEAEKLHNLFPLAYAKVPFEKFQMEHNLRGFNVTREGYAGIQRYPYIFAGDWPSEWQYFEPVIRAGLNIGLSGVGYWAHCMGGFEHAADPELYIRWTQFGLMSPVAHLFGMDHPGYKEPWNYGEEAERIFKKYDRLRYRLLPYIYSESYTMHKTGMPLMRALVLEYQNDSNTYDIDDEYLFGGSLLIAPVTTKGAQTRVVYLPEGTWFDYWTGERFSGKQYLNVVTPLEKLPIFVKAGSILPQRNRIEQVGEQPADTLSLEIFPYGNSSYDIYDDDGQSKDYLDGEYSLTTVSVDDNSERTGITISSPEGGFEVPERSYKLVLHGEDFSDTGNVLENGRELEAFTDPAMFERDSDRAGWLYDQEEQKLWIRLQGSSAVEISVTVSKND